MRVLPGVTLLVLDELLSAALGLETELGVIVRATASVAHIVTKDKVCD
jgi:hypothetical protein